MYFDHDLWTTTDTCFRRHFYANEHPELLARDLKIMFGKRGGAYGAVAGKDGYVQAGRARL
jgi:hypothetical protein